MVQFWFRQIERDCEFLEAERIMDYSLLVGVHFRDDNTGDKIGLSPFVLRGIDPIILLYPHALSFLYICRMCI